MSFPPGQMPSIDDILPKDDPRGDPPSYSRQLPPNHINVPNPYNGATVSNAPQSVHPMSARSHTAREYAQAIQIQPHTRTASYSYPEPDYRSNSFFGGQGLPQHSTPIQKPNPNPDLDTNYGWGPSPYSTSTSPALRHPSPWMPRPYTPYPPSHLPDQPAHTPHSQHASHTQPQPPMTTQIPTQTHAQMHSSTSFQEHGYPGPGILPPGGRWAIVNDEEGERNLWIIMPGEKKPVNCLWMRGRV
ncbi:hypothetical protein VTL71DRAFT_4082 [Oculimacula yallundae]|uniref:Uncharacterized protein n=1 Tax=Oculimacula yallundae TaxID=86028 RepID=A0ABR4C4S4_9HELO